MYQEIIRRHYTTITVILLAVVIYLSYTIGTLQNKSVNGTEVLLQCDENVLKKLEIPLEQSTLQKQSYRTTGEGTPSGAFVGSKNGTKYYAPECASVKRIKPENLRWFRNEEDATIQGYTKGNC